MKSYYNHNINTDNGIRHYRICSDDVNISLLNIQLHKPVIYLREFYADETVHGYYDLIIENMVKRDSSHFYYFVGKRGTGKSTFAIWILYGLHLRRDIIFITPDDLRNHSLISFLNVSLDENPDKIFVFDAGDEKGENINAMAQILFDWVNQYIGLKVIFINDNPEITVTVLNTENVNLLKFPEFRDLPPDNANLLFAKLGMSFNAREKMNHSEIFKTYFRENLSWKSQQQ